MKKKILMIMLAAAFVFAATGCQSGNETQTEAVEQASEAETAAEAESETAAAEAADLEMIEKTDYFADQAVIDEALAQEAAAGYDFAEPQVIMNPYGTSPLTAVVAFTTEEEIGGTITVKGKAAEDDITGTFKAATDHLVPVYGLYNGEETEVVLTLDDGTSTTLNITTEKQEVPVGEINVEMTDASAYDYSKLTFVCSLGAVLYATDSKGDVRWFYNSANTLGVHQLENGHLMMPTAYTLRTSYYKSGLQEIDLNGRVYTEYAIPGGVHHDFYEMSNGNLLVASDSQDLTSVEDCVVEIDRETGEVVWSLDMKDILDTTDGQSASNLTDGSEEIDWYHNNGVWYDEANDLVLMSARHVDSIVAVNKSDKTLAWILGDPTGWTTVDEKYFFTPVGDNFEWQYAQHQVTMLDNGDIMMFDNGSAKVKIGDNDNRVTGDDIYSRAVVYHIDTENMTIEQVFEYGKERGAEWYSDWVSGAITLDGTVDNLWLTAGSHLYSAEEDTHEFFPTNMFTPGLVKSTHIDQVTNGELVYEMVISGDAIGALSYRSLRLPMYGEGDLDLEAAINGLKGDLGEKKPVEEEIVLDGAEALPEGDWAFKLDDTKFTVSGTYTTEAAADALEAAYLVFECGDEVKAWSLTQNGTAKDDGTTAVKVTGWTSTTGLEGKVWHVYLIMDGKTYDTGKGVQM